MKRVLPATLCTLVAGAYVLWRLALSGWEPSALFEIGERYSARDSEGSEGYDGQFFYFIALDPNPSRVAPKLDVPAYRYQRILFPLLARGIALGTEAGIPWAMLGVGLASIWAGTYSVSELLDLRNLNRWCALSFGLWVGLVAPVGTGLSEPLAYGLVAGAMLALTRGQKPLAAGLFGLAAFAKETTLPFLAAAFVAELLSDRKPKALGAYLAVGVIYAAWQVWLARVFGSMGIASGGDMATGFEWIPYLGLIRIGSVSLAALGLYLLIFGPSIVLPSLWGAILSIRELLRGARDAETLALLANCGIVMALPFSTFREPLGLVRLADGLVLSVILFAGSRRLIRPLRYSLFWSGLLAILVAQ